MTWYVVETHAGATVWRRTVEALERDGIDIYGPLCCEAGSQGANPKPMFPWYAFVRLDLRRGGWIAVSNTPGVKQLLRSAPIGPPTPLRAGVVEQLRAMELGGAIELAPRLKSGQTVRITRGIFAGHEGIISRKRGKRLAALLQFFGHQREVEMTEADVIALDGAVQVAV